MDRSKSEKTDDAHTMRTDSLKSTVRSSKLKGADMRGIQKIPNKDGTKSYRAQVRLNDGLSPQSKSFPTLVEARTWKAQEETKRRQGMYFPSMTSKQNKLDALIDRYIAKVLPSKPKNARNTQQHLLWWKTKLGNLSLNKIPRVISSKPIEDVREKSKGKHDALSLIISEDFLTNSQLWLPVIVNQQEPNYLDQYCKIIRINGRTVPIRQRLAYAIELMEKFSLTSKDIENRLRDAFKIVGLSQSSGGISPNCFLNQCHYWKDVDLREHAVP